MVWAACLAASMIPGTSCTRSKTESDKGCTKQLIHVVPTFSSPADAVMRPPGTRYSKASRKRGIHSPGTGSLLAKPAATRSRISSGVASPPWPYFCISKSRHRGCSSIPTREIAVISMVDSFFSGCKNPMQGLPKPPQQDEVALGDPVMGLQRKKGRRPVETMLNRHFTLLLRQ